MPVAVRLRPRAFIRETTTNPIRLGSGLLLSYERPFSLQLRDRENRYVWFSPWRSLNRRSRSVTSALQKLEQPLFAAYPITVSIEMAAISWIASPDRRGACCAGGSTVSESSAAG